MKRSHRNTTSDNKMTTAKRCHFRRVILCAVSVLLVAGTLFRIAYINATAEKISVITCPQGKWGELSGSYLLSNEEKTEDYAIRINTCQLSVYSDYSAFLSSAEEQQNVKQSRRAQLGRIADDTPVITVNLTIRNFGEESGSLNFAGCVLTSKYFNSQTEINFDILPLFDDKIKEAQFISIRPNTEYTLTVPFLIRDIPLEEIEKNGPFYLAATKYPTRLLLECPLST